MLALAGALIVVVLLVAVVSNRVSPLVALVLIPVAGCWAAGMGHAVPAYMLSGIAKIAPMVGMFVFAILFFGVMTDAGLLAPIVAAIMRMVGHHPERITLGTAALALLIHLDGSGAVCFLVTVPAMLPVYDRLGMDRRVLACTASLAAGVNFLPWTGPTLRASAALSIPVSQIFTPMIGVQAVGLVFVFAAAWWLGRREARRLGLVGHNSEPSAAPLPEPPPLGDLLRPRLYPFNLALTLLVLGLMISGKAEPVVVFMIGSAIALAVNYPSADAQRARIEAHARAALLMASILLAAGAFTGIMTGSGMIAALAKVAVSHVSPAMGPHIPVAMAVVGMPLSLMFDPDSFYFGVLPVIVDIARHFGVAPVQVAQAALLGMHTTGFPVSPLTPATFLVAGLARVELGAHQRFCIPWLLGATLVMTVAAVLFGLFPL